MKPDIDLYHQGRFLSVSLFRDRSLGHDSCRISIRRSSAKLRPIVIALAASVILLGTVIVAWLSGFDPTDGPYQQPPDKPSLAVLPFQNLGEDPAQAYFAHGMTDDLITDLLKIPGLFVIAGNSSALYENAKMDIRDIARELGVRYILTGILRRTPTMLRLNTQLIDAESGSSLWAERYDADLVQIFALQDVIVSHVVAALSAGTSPTEELAIGEAEKAIALDGNDPTAHIVLAYALSTAGEGSSAVEHAMQAMRLNPHYPASYVWTLGLAYFVNADYERARKFFEEAGTDQAGLDLVPLLATYGFLGREEEAGNIFDLQLSRWQEWHPGYPMTVRSLVAGFPPFLKQPDRDRVSDGLEKAIAHRLSLRSGASIPGPAGSARRAHRHWPAAALVRKGRLWRYYRRRGFALQ